MAAKTVLPLALSDIAALASNNARLNFDPNDLIGSHPPATTPREIGVDTITVLRDCIEYADPVDGEALGDLIRTYQVLWARAGRSARGQKLESNKADITGDHEMLSEAFNWAALHAMVDRIFPYGRGETEGIPEEFEPTAIKSALLNCGIDFDIFPNMKVLHDIRQQDGRLFLFPR